MSKNKNMTGKEYWRSMDQLADTPEFQEFLHREFPEGASEMKSAMSRRNFLTIMGASMALAGLTACRRPVEKIVPYVVAPEEVIPGVAEYYATTMPFGVEAYGVVVESHEGRPTKIEGNSKHPATRGKSNSMMQAAILGLYDPDRSRAVLNAGKEKTWTDFLSYWAGLFSKYSANQGEGLAVVAEANSSPTMFRLKKAFSDQFPKAKWVTYGPVSDENIYAGIARATGTPLAPLYTFERAKVVLSVDSDFLMGETDNVKNTRGFAASRKMSSAADDMNRLYAVESSFTVTGGMADHRLRLPASHIAAFTLALAKELRAQGLEVAGADGFKLPAGFAVDKKWLGAAARDLMRNRGKSLVIAGRLQPVFVHALVYSINQALLNEGKTVTYRSLDDVSVADSSAFAALVADMNDGKVETLVMSGVNPVYDAPADLDFAVALEKVANTVHHGMSVDETAEKAQWHVPQAHFLEAWGDARALDGTLSVVQPLIAPLFAGKSDVELATVLLTGKEGNGFEQVQATWKTALKGRDFDKEWRRVLHDGVLEGSAASTSAPKVNLASLVKTDAAAALNVRELNAGNNELVMAPSYAAYDGRFNNNGWMQELPDPITKLAWDNAALMSPRTASELSVNTQDLIVLNLNGRELAVAVSVLPGMADYSISLSLGYGRKKTGRIGTGAGFNAYVLRTSDAPAIATGVTVRKLGKTYPLANTQDHSSMEGRPIVREATVTEYKESPKFAEEMVEHPPLISLWDEHPYDTGYQWGMTIDLNACSGCNACAIACQSENNIPVVGKEQVKNGREMHWLRLDRYFTGDIEEPEMVFQPVGCQHCENAPCEQVCPVQATSHDKEGLNVMTYNRCIGTRYCSNNCPYKVRRFNFFNHTKDLPEIVQLAQNPDVTVRSRGVMEKCTYCLQRVNEAKITSKREGRTIADGEVMSACQQACPADAIVFGNLLDKDSAVAKSKQVDRRYEMLAELNVKPRTSYLGKLRNPNPELI